MGSVNCSSPSCVSGQNRSFWREHPVKAIKDAQKMTKNSEIFPICFFISYLVNRQSSAVTIKWELIVRLLFQYELKGIGMDRILVYWSVCLLTSTSRPELGKIGHGSGSRTNMGRHPVCACIDRLEIFPIQQADGDHCRK